MNFHLLLFLSGSTSKRAFVIRPTQSFKYHCVSLRHFFNAFSLSFAHSSRMYVRVANKRVIHYFISIFHTGFQFVCLHFNNTHAFGYYTTHKKFAGNIIIIYSFVLCRFSAIRSSFFLSFSWSNSLFVFPQFLILICRWSVDFVVSCRVEHAAAISN